jgi:hypothetical protein
MTRAGSSNPPGAQARHWMPPLSLILVLGLRNGEVLGLTWGLVGLHAEL